MLVTLYIMYKKVLLGNGVARRQLLSHHDFRKAIAFAWINPAKHWTSPGPMKTRKSNNSSNSSGRTAKRMKRGTRTTTPTTTPADVSRKQGQYTLRFDDKSLSEHGALSARLNRAFAHFPLPSTGRKRCGLHRWCGFEKFRFVVECKDCSAAPCVDCYKVLHTKTDLPSLNQRMEIKTR